MSTIRIEVSGQSFDAPLPAAAVSVGRAEDADLRLQCDGVAGQHCVLEPLPGGRYKLRDANSGYPTRVNGIVVKQVSLSDGDVIEVGAVRIVYTTAGAPAPTPAATPAPAPAAAAAATPAPAAALPARPAPARPAPAKAAPARAAPAQAAPADDLPLQGVAAKPEAKPAPAAPTSARGEAPKKSKAGALLGVGIGIVALVIVVWAAGGLSDSGDGNPGLQQAYADGMRAYDAKDYERARMLWSRVVRDARGSPLGIKAKDRLGLIGAVDGEMRLALDSLWAQRLDLDGSALGRARGSFQDTFGANQLARFEAKRDLILQAQAAWKRDELAEMVGETKQHVAQAQFAEARENWRRFARAAPAAIDITADVDAALQQLITDAGARAEGLVARSEAWIQAGQAFRGVKLLSDMLPKFAGLPSHARLSKALATAEAARDKPVEYTPPAPGSDEPSGKPTQPAPPKPATTESEQKALAAKVSELLAQAEPWLKKRRYGDAAEVVKQALGALPDGEKKQALAGLAADWALAEKGLQRLVATIQSHTKRFGGVKLTERMTVSLVSADRDMLAARVTGGSSKWRWERLVPSAFGSLVARMRPGRDDALPAAALLHAVGLDAQAERTLYAAGQSGVPTTELFPVLARWRKETVPEGGYVVYQERYVTPGEREHLVLEAQITAALKQVDAREAKDRKAAYEALLALGEPAVARLKDALDRRRAFLIQEIASSRSFTGGKYKAKLLALLDQRRKHALALIYDGKAYPYPNPQKKSQKEVEARVDKVREVWERPFDLVAQWDKKLLARLEIVTEVDEYLSRVDPGYAPDLEELKARINKAIDVPSAADPSKREYSLKVQVYNTTLDCTATTEEKNNVRSVNEYRMMMGLLAVKINERLTRAARGHSRHMQKNGYFAHNVPSAYATPQNRTPGARVKRQGFGGGCGENIARGPSTGHGAFMAWFRSSGHHRNMLGRSWLQLGCGRADGTWWTQNFAGGSKSLKPPDALPAPDAAFAPEPEDKNGRPIPPGKIEVPDEVPPGDEGDEGDEGDGSDDEGGGSDDGGG